VSPPTNRHILQPQPSGPSRHGLTFTIPSAGHKGLMKKACTCVWSGIWDAE
jgi:hypothetical protein